MPTLQEARFPSQPVRDLLSISTALCLATSLCGGAGAGAIAADRHGLLAQEKPAPIQKLEVTTTGTTVTLTATPQSVFITTISKKREKLQTLLGDAVTKGMLSQSQQEELRAELDRVAKEEAIISGAGNDAKANSKVVGLARSLDDVGTKLNVVFHSEVSVPLIQGAHFAVVSGQWVELDDVAIRRWDLEGRISKLLADNRVTLDQAKQLRAQMDAIGDKESTMRADNNLDFKESRILYQDFDRVGRKIEDLEKQKPRKS